jgi:hypothetical protein
VFSLYMSQIYRKEWQTVPEFLKLNIDELKERGKINII